MEKKEKKRSTLALTRCVLECRLLFPYTSFHRLKKTIFHDPHISCFFYATVVSEKRCMTFMMSFNVHPKRIVGRAGQVSWGTCSYSCYLKALAGVWGREFVFHFKSLLVTNRVSQCCLFFRWLTMPFSVKSIHVGTRFLLFLCSHFSPFPFLKSILLIGSFIFVLFLTSALYSNCKLLHV